MTTTQQETTDGSARPRWRRAVSVRLRITVAVVVLTALALGGAGVAVFILQAQRLSTGVDASIDRDLARFQNVVKAATSSATTYAAMTTAITATAAMRIHTLTRPLSARRARPA
jgi:hypothetical protein